MKILIVGAGIGGLAAASFLERKNFDVTIVERAPEFKHIGFGMTLFSNGRRILQHLGIDELVSRQGYEVPYIQLADPKGHILDATIDFRPLHRFGLPVIIIERAALHESLVSNLRNVRLMLGTSVKSLVSSKDAVSVVLSDDSKHVFDLVIGADGINSKIREDIFGHGQSSFYDWSLRFFWVPSHIPIPEGALCLSQERTMLALYPLKDRCFAGIYEYNPKRINHLPLSLQSFLPYLLSHGWTSEDIESLTKEAQEGKQYYDHLRIVTIDDWYKDRIVLLGDARHGLSPITGMGASMALEDAFVLVDELSKTDSNHIEIALKSYVQRRVHRVKEIRALSSLAERFYFIESRFGKLFRDVVVRIFPTRLLMSRLEHILSRPL